MVMTSNDQVFILTTPAASRKKALLFVEETLFHKWGLQFGESLTIFAGRRSVPLLAQPFTADSPTIRISHEAKEFLHLPPISGPVSVLFEPKSRAIRIGPVMAVLINHELRDDGHFGEMEKFYQEMEAYCRKHGFPFFLMKLQSAAEEVLEGYFLAENGWTQMFLPFPDVIYNRIHSRRMESSAAFAQFTDELRAKEIPLFNGRFLAKHEVHQHLLLEHELLEHLPDTILLGEKEHFLSFIDRHHLLYFKPSSGSQGKNICRMTFRDDGFWLIEHAASTHKAFTVETKEKLFHTLKRLSRNREYIIQKGLLLFEKNQRKVDFRILLHKNEQLQWKVTSMVARAGDPGKIVSNLAQGGIMQNAADFLKETFKREEAALINQSLMQLARKTAKALDEHHEEHFGELGIDLALDTELHPWIIEVNSKPSKKFQGNYEAFRPSVKSLIDFMYTLKTQNHS